VERESESTSSSGRRRGGHQASSRLTRDLVGGRGSSLSENPRKSALKLASQSGKELHADQKGRGAGANARVPSGPAEVTGPNSRNKGPQEGKRKKKVTQEVNDIQELEAPTPRSCVLQKMESGDQEVVSTPSTPTAPFGRHKWKRTPRKGATDIDVIANTQRSFGLDARRRRNKEMVSGDGRLDLRWSKGTSRKCSEEAGGEKPDGRSEFLLKRARGFIPPSIGPEEGCKKETRERVTGV